MKLTCQYCKKDFQRSLGDIKRGRTKFCSLECYWKWRKGKPCFAARRRILKTCPRCGKEFEKGGRAGSKKQIYCSNHCSNLRQNGRTISASGYIMRLVNGKRILEQRIVAEEILGRPLNKDEIVHHINGIKTDNRKENLVITTQSKHRKLVDYLAKLWVDEHQDIVEEVTRKFTWECQLSAS